MKTILPQPTKVGTVVLPPIFPENTFTPPSDLTPQELLDAIKQATFEVPSQIMDIAQIALHTVRLSLNHGAEETEQGQMSLAFFDPCFYAFEGNLVIIERHLSNLLFLQPPEGGSVWLLLPIGKRYTIDFSVQSKRKNTAFHVGVRYKDYSNEYTFATTGEGQHLSFNVDTRESIFYGIDIRNFNRTGKNALIFETWTFFNCTIVQLD